jgi:hypothetical protein
VAFGERCGGGQVGAGTEAGGETLQLLGFGPPVHGVEQPEELLDPGWDDDLEHAGRAVVGVPEGVPLAAGLDEEAAGLHLHLLAAEEGPDPALQHVGVLVLAFVHMDRACERAWREQMLDQRQRAAAGLGLDEETVLDAIGEPNRSPPPGGMIAWAAAGTADPGTSSSCRVDATGGRRARLVTATGRPRGALRRATADGDLCKCAVAPSRLLRNA